MRRISHMKRNRILSSSDDDDSESQKTASQKNNDDTVDSQAIAEEDDDESDQDGDQINNTDERETPAGDSNSGELESAPAPPVMPTMETPASPVLNEDVRGRESSSEDENAAEANQLGARDASPGAVSLSDFTMGGICDEMMEDEGCPLYLRKDFCGVPKRLKNTDFIKFDVPLEIVCDEHGVICVPDQHVKTMDGVGKCLQLISTDDLSHYVQPCDGFPLTFVARCNGVGIPPHIMTVLHWFYRLQEHTQTNGLTQFVLPTATLRLQYSSKDKKKVRCVQEVRERDSIELDQDQDVGSGSSNVFRLGPALRKRSRHSMGEVLREKPPFTVRLAYTGAIFKDGDEFKQELFCVCIVTPLRNFDILSCISQSFLVRPACTHDGKYADWNSLYFAWKTILQYEANTNCGMMGDPCDYQNEPGGELGVFTLTNLLNVPLRISEVIRQRCARASDIKIIGMPKLSFQDDEIMGNYVRYMDEYINHQVKSYDKLQQDILVYCTTLPADRRDMRFEISHPGGWPLKAVTSESENPIFLRFGVFPFPIIMWFKVSKQLSANVNLDSFSLNIGTLPAAVSKKERDFLTCDPSFQSEAVIDDSHILTNRVPATPHLISERFYGKGAQPVEDFKTVGRMLSWYEAMVTDMQSRRLRDVITPVRAMELVWRHLRSCMENHTGMLTSGEYRSDHLEQAYFIVSNLKTSQLKNLSIASYANAIRMNKVDESIRHDPYLSMSMTFMSSLQDINREFVLNATNLECFMEMLMSSVHYLLGSHNSSFVDFFQGVMIMGARGHLDMQDKEGVMMDWRKPNSSGAGTIQDRINKMQVKLPFYYLCIGARLTRIFFWF